MADGEATIDDIIRDYEKRGYGGQFATRLQGVLHCYACGEDEPAAQAPVLAMHRVEGTSDPSDMALVAAVECPACGDHGTLVLSYGPEVSAEDAGVLSELLDDRDQAHIAPGT